CSSAVDRPSLASFPTLRSSDLRLGRILMVGHLLEYHPAVRALEALILSGELGRLQYVYSNRLNLGRFRREENALWSFAPHDVARSEEHTSELQSREKLVCRLLL